METGHISVYRDPSSFIERQSKKLKKESSIELPLEIIVLIFNFLSPIDVRRCFTVCKNWRQTKKFFIATSENFNDESISIIDRRIWEYQSSILKSSLFELENEPLLLKCDIEKIKALMKSKGINQHLTILTIPKGLDIGFLKKIFAKKEIQLDYHSPHREEVIEFEKRIHPSDKIYRLVITTQVFESSCGLTFSKQNALINEKRGRLIKVLELTALVALRTTKDQTLTSLFSRCADEAKKFNRSKRSYTLRIYKEHSLEVSHSFNHIGFNDLGSVAAWSLNSLIEEI